MAARVWSIAAISPRELCTTAQDTDRSHSALCVRFRLGRARREARTKASNFRFVNISAQKRTEAQRSASTKVLLATTATENAPVMPRSNLGSSPADICLVMFSYFSGIKPPQLGKSGGSPGSYLRVFYHHCQSSSSSRYIGHTSAMDLACPPALRYPTTHNCTDLQAATRNLNAKTSNNTSTPGRHQAHHIPCLNLALRDRLLLEG